MEGVHCEERNDVAAIFRSRLYRATRQVLQCTGHSPHVHHRFGWHTARRTYWRRLNRRQAEKADQARAGETIDAKVAVTFPDINDRLPRSVAGSTPPLPSDRAFRPVAAPRETKPADHSGCRGAATTPTDNTSASS